MLRRHSYRAYPTPGQRQKAERTFGCVRRVFNDFLAERDRLFNAGTHKDVSFNETATRVTTHAKTTPQRAWLAEVSNTPLQQSVRDAQQAYRNWFASLSGKRRGRKVGKPRFKSRRDHRQSARFTRNCGFTVRSTTHGVAHVRLPKIGWVRFSLSRPLPTDPSSVTLIKEADNTYWLSFVVEVPVPPVAPARQQRSAGLDAGIGDDLLSIVYDDGTRERVPNPRHLRTAQRRLTRAQRSLSRTRKGSTNRAKARIAVARAHRKVRQARLDHHHKLAGRLVATITTIAIEDLSLTGMGRTRLAKSVHDAGIGLLYRLLHEKAETQGCTVTTIGRWEPTTQTCAVCGTPGGKKPLHVRTWTCSGCGTLLDRDYNAAVNILVAAGLAETLNACRGSVRLRLAGADPTKQEPTERHLVT